MVLHTVNAPPRSTSFTDCLRLAGAADTILLLGDGVYAALPGGEAWRELQACAAQVAVLGEDAAAAGILERLADVDIVDFAGFVELTERYPRQMAWY